MSPRRRHPPGRLRPAFSLAEAIAAVGLLAMGVVAVLTAAGGAVGRRQDAQGRGMAESLVAEVLEEARVMAYQDPTLPTTALGQEAGESAGARSALDDVDDLNGWVEDGIADRDGSAIAGLGKWKRCVWVEWVDTATGSVVSSSETGLKRVRVEVSRGGRLVASGSILRARAWAGSVP